MEVTMTRLLLPLTLAATLIVAGCATSPKVQVVQPGDQKMDCAEISRELASLDDAQQEIDSKKGMTGTNVAAFLFWWPGLAYTYYDAGQATQAVNERRSHLTTLHNQGNC
jgi:hypothetical protein